MDGVLDAKVQFISCPTVIQMFWILQLLVGISISFFLILIINPIIFL